VAMVAAQAGLALLRHVLTSALLWLREALIISRSPAIRSSPLIPILPPLPNSVGQVSDGCALSLWDDEFVQCGVFSDRTEESGVQSGPNHALPLLGTLKGRSCWKTQQPVVIHDLEPATETKG